MSTVREEWRVTGNPGTYFPHYSYVWGTEDEARKFVAAVTKYDGWDEGPFLSRRTITETDWREVQV